jgi:fatty acid synthase subunit alpha
VFQNGSGSWMVRLRKGSVLNILRALSFDRFVNGQIPCERLGLSKELIDAVGLITLYVLTSTMDLFVAVGVTDPYELPVRSCFGQHVRGGMGGMRALTHIY